MKHILPVACVVGAVAGAVSGALTIVLSPDTTSPAASSSLIVDGPDDAVLEELGALSEKIDELNDRITFVEQRPAAPTRTAVDDGALIDPDVAKISDELRDLATALRNPDGAQIPANFQETVNRALSNIRDQEDQEREVRREEARAQALEDRLVRLAENLSLAPYQVDEFRKIYTDRDLKMAEMRQQMQDGGGDWTNAREGFRTLRDESNKAIEAMLTPEQYTKYQETEDRGRGGRGGGPGGGR